MGELTRVKVALAWKKKTQRELAREVGMHEVTLSDILRGRTVPTEGEKARIAHALRIPVDRLFSTLTDEEMTFLYGPQKARKMKRRT